MICGMTPQEAVAIWRLRQEKAKLLRDEDSGSMLCPACGGYEEHKGECKG
jgi:hypothetical protein